ncbi:MAG: elongation factor Ts, partial [Oligoflexia bacterium]|nr:elongation factor Ts [Oligoflexia bacterium]
KKGLSTAAKKSDRKAVEGLIFSYIHGNGRIGVLLEVNSETDFVARNENFKIFVKQLSLHILAMQPLYIKEEDIPEELKEKEKRIFKEQSLSKAKKPEIAERITAGLYKKWLEEVCLLKQEFVRENQEGRQTIEQALNELISRVGENVVIRRFARFALGETHEEKKS